MGESLLRKDSVRRPVFALVGLALTVGLIFPSFSAAQTANNSEADPAEAEQSLETTDWFEVDKIPGGDRVFGDFVVGPGKVELEVQPGESKTVIMTVTNRIGQLQRFNFDIEDATGSDDPSKTVELLGNERGPYTLKDYISIPEDSLEIGHNERAKIPVTITVPADAEPGGRYGSVLVNTVAVERGVGEGGEVSSQSPIVARIGTLFFITIPGDGEREGELKDFTTIPDQKWFNQGPITFGVLFENKGNLHLAPYGKLSITNMFGQEVGYNELDPWFAMPDSLRFREIIWENTRLLGKYTATIEVNRSYEDIIDTKSVSFWVIPWQTILTVFIAVFVVMFLIRSFFKRFEFRRKT